MLQSSLPTVVFDTGFTDRQPEHLPRTQLNPIVGLCSRLDLFRLAAAPDLKTHESRSIPRIKWGLRRFVRGEPPQNQNDQEHKSDYDRPECEFHQNEVAR